MGLRLGWVDSYLSSFAVFGFIKATVRCTPSKMKLPEGETQQGALEYFVTLQGCGGKRRQYPKKFKQLDEAKLYAESCLREHYNDYAKIGTSQLKVVFIH